MPSRAEARRQSSAQRVPGMVAALRTCVRLLAPESKVGSEVVRPQRFAKFLQRQRRIRVFSKPENVTVVSVLVEIDGEDVELVPVLFEVPLHDERWQLDA